MPSTILLVGAPTFADVEAACGLMEAEAQNSNPETESFITAPTSSIGSDESFGDAFENTDTHLAAILHKQASSKLDSFRFDHAKSPSSEGLPQWRILQPSPRHLRTDWTQRDWLAYTPLEWVQRSVARNPVAMTAQDSVNRSTSSDTEFDEDFADLVDKQQNGEDEFLEKSFALHEDHTDSSVTPATSSSRRTRRVEASLTPIIESSDEDETQDMPSSPLAPKSARKTPAQPTKLTASVKPFKLPSHPPMRLEGLPSASDILHARPATLSAHLIVGILMLKPEREVTIRRTGRSVTLLEAVVSDGSTPQGFGLSFWLEDSTSCRSRTHSSPKHNLASELRDISAGDVVLITDIALSQWKGRSYGSSIARRSWRTRVRLLWRRSTGWSSLGRSILAPDSGTTNWRDRTKAVKIWAELSVVSLTSPRVNGVQQRMSTERNGQLPSAKRKWLPDDDTFEF